MLAIQLGMFLYELSATPSVAFVVFSRSQSLTAPLGRDTLLDCGFKQQEPFPARAMWLEWRLQHRGSGSRVLEMKAVGPEEQPIGKKKRKDR